MNDISVLCFLSVSETHSFSNTARDLQITQQAVSRHIQKLEEELGFSLLIRDHNMVTPSVAGSQFLQFIKKSTLERHAIENRLLAGRDTIHIGISELIGNIPPVRQSAAVYQKSHPEHTLIFYEINAVSADSMIRNGSLDSYIAPSYELELIHESGQYIKLTEDTLCIIQSSSTEAKHFHLTTSIGEQDDSIIIAREARLHHELGLNPHPIKIYPNYASVLLNVSIGNGVCFGWKNARMIDNPFLTICPTGKNTDIMMGIYSEERAPAIKHFADLIGDFCNE